MTNDPTHGDSNQGSNANPQQPPQPQAHTGNPQAANQQYAAGSNGGAHNGEAPAQTNPYFDFTDYQFRMPTSWPRSAGEALPSFRGGFRNFFQTAHMPMDARIGYWIWLVGCVLAIIGWIFSMGAILIGILVSPLTLIGTGMMSLFGEIRWGVVVFYVISMLVSLVLLVVQLVLTLKIRERAEWARLALTVITVVTIVYSSILAAADAESGGAGSVAASILSLLLIAFFWMPKANEWFLRAGEGTDAAGAGRTH